MKKILVAGATGNLGPHIVRALRAHGKDVYALLRPQTMNNAVKVAPLKAVGAYLVQGDLEDPASLRRACAGMDAVVSAVGPGQILLQPALFEAAGEAGVSRVIPTEFGLDPHVAGPGSNDLFDAKLAAQQVLKASGLPYTMIYANCFMEFWGIGLGEVFHPAPPAEVSFFGDGTQRIALTAMADVGRYTAAVLDDPGAANREVRLSINVRTQEELIRTWERVSGRAVKRRPVSATRLERSLQPPATPETFQERFLAQMYHSAWIRGDGMKVRPGVLEATVRYPEIRPVRVEAFFNGLMKMARA